MTRIGINPARGKTSGYRPARVSVTLLTYIPSLEGYFQGRLEVLKAAFSSLAANTSLPHDLLVFDNGSCNQAVEYLRSLQQAGSLNYLLLSERNIGKVDALKILFNAAPGELIAYSDDDLLFYPGWLEAHLEILENFPNAGMVSGQPVRNAAGHAMQSVERFASRQGPGMRASRERFIPEDWERDWALSTGRDPAAHLQATSEQMDLVFRAEKPGGQGLVEAVGAANHFQYLTPKAVILRALPQEWTGKLMGAMIELDERVDTLGYLRLSTARRFTRHLGNSLSDEARAEISKMVLPARANNGTAAPGAGRQKRRKHWLLRLPGGRKLVHSLYRRLFEILFN
jgi:glycosyltransferase involved in cell wall biosynthesis